jgi:hypothetical protein
MLRFGFIFEGDYFVFIVEGFRLSDGGKIVGRFGFVIGQQNCDL